MLKMDFVQTHNWRQFLSQVVIRVHFVHKSINLTRHAVCYNVTLRRVGGTIVAVEKQ